MEMNLATKHFQLCKDEETFFKQRFWVQWLAFRDKDTNFFHKSLIYGQAMKKNYNMMEEDNNYTSDVRDMGNLAMRYFQRVLTTPSQTFVWLCFQVFFRLEILWYSESFD